jgi:chromosome partitioning protein
VVKYSKSFGREIRMEGKVISFINMKGGVGKTTLSLGIADYLADNGYNFC